MTFTDRSSTNTTSLDNYRIVNSNNTGGIIGWVGDNSAQEHDPGIVISEPGVWITGGSSSTRDISEGSGITISKRERQSTEDSKPRVSADIYFKYVKGRLKKSHEAELRVRLDNLMKLAKTCVETGQDALADQILREQAVTIRTQEVASAGYGSYVDIDTIRKYSTKTSVVMDDLSRFPRPIPTNVRDVIKKVKATKLFDSLVVLHHNPTQEEITSTKDKIITKDPILFGKIAFLPDRYFFVVDWIDEVCDLTFGKFINTLKTADPSFETMDVQPISKREAEDIKLRAMESIQRLANTNGSRWKHDALVQGMSNEQFSWKKASGIATALGRSMWRTIRRK